MGVYDRILMRVRARVNTGPMRVRARVYTALICVRACVYTTLMCVQCACVHCVDVCVCLILYHSLNPSALLRSSNLLDAD